MDCDVVKLNLGVSRCNKMPEMLVGMITTPANFTIPAATLADPTLLLDFLNEKLLAPVGERIYYWPDFKSFENLSQEAVYEDTPYAYLPVRDGNYRFRFGIRENMCIHKAMYTHRGSGGGVIFLDSENQFLLSEKSNGDGLAIRVQVLHTEKMLFNDGSVSSKSPIVVALLNNKDIDKAGILVPFENSAELHRLVDAKLKIVGTPTATTIVTEVVAACDNTPLTGLVLTDFLIKDDDDGATHATTTVVEDTTQPGKYTLTGVAYENSKLSLAPPATLSVKPYESVAPVQVTVV